MTSPVVLNKTRVFGTRKRCWEIGRPICTRPAVPAAQLFHLAHALLDAGLTDIEPHAGKTQKSSVFWATLLAPFLRFAVERAYRRRRRSYGALLPEIEQLARLNNSWPVLTGRTLIVTARKRV